MTKDIIAAIKDRLGDAQKILVTSHVRPDGDAVGSLLGLGLALQNAGKTVQMIAIFLSRRFMRASHLVGIARPIRRPGLKMPSAGFAFTPSLAPRQGCCARELNRPALRRAG